MINDSNVLIQVKYVATEIVVNALGAVFFAVGATWHDMVCQETDGTSDSECTIEFSGGIGSPVDQGRRFSCLMSASFAKHSDGQWHWYFTRIVMGNPGDELKADCPQERIAAFINRRSDFCTEAAYKHADEGEFKGYLPDRSVLFEAA